MYFLVLAKKEHCLVFKLLETMKLFRVNTVEKWRKKINTVAG